MTVSAVEFGIVLRSTTEVAAHARRIEALGFDVIACGEHLAFHVPVPNSFITLAVAAGTTERVKLFATIVALPLYPAALAAKMGAALDVASGGRYEMGVGIGGEYAPEFQACGIPISERGPRSDEALAIILKTWTEGDVSFSGRFNSFDGLSIEPRPIQKPHPPIWVAGRREGAMRRAATFADGWLPYMYTPELLAGSVERVRELRAELGRGDQPMRTGLFISVACNADGNVARRYAGERLGKHYAQNFDQRIAKYSVAGTPQECRRRLSEYVSAGAQRIVMASACPDDYIEANERLIAEEVLPGVANSG